MAALTLPLFSFGQITQEQVNAIRSRAESTNTDLKAKSELALMYLLGKGVPQDTSMALKFLREIDAWAEANKVKMGGYVPAGTSKIQCLIGEIYAFGDPRVPRDLAEAARWFLKSAANGYPNAQNNLGELLANGRGVKKDLIEAIGWFRKAAEAGHVKAQYNLGNCYLQGDGVASDFSQAVTWFRKAAEGGHSAAQFQMGVLCLAGIDVVSKDEKQAVAWFRKSAEQGDSDAQFWLGELLAKGTGVDKDQVEAFAYLSLARANSPGANSKLPILEKKMTADEISAGVRRAKELQKEIEAKMAAKKAGK